MERNYKKMTEKIKRDKQKKTPEPLETSKANTKKNKAGRSSYPNFFKQTVKYMKIKDLKILWLLSQPTREWHIY